MTVTLVVPAQIADEFLQAVRLDVESAGVLLAKLVETPGGNIRLLVRTLHWVPEDAYLVRNSDTLRIASHGYIPALADAEADSAVPIWLHTHPGDDSSPEPSGRDDIVDQELSDVFRLRSGSLFYGAIVLARSADGLCFSGHIESAESEVDIDRLWVVGRRFTLVHNWYHKGALSAEQFDRNIRAFGGSVQEVLGGLNVAVIGCGGTGSAVIEQLARLGVRHFHLFDPDTLTVSNLTRVYGSIPEDVGSPKVELSAAHVKRIAPDAEVHATRSKITLEATAKLLLDADVVFGCTDDNAGRLVLSRVASYLMTPVIDCGVLLSSGADGQLEGIDGRVTVLAPGAACLLCRNRIDLGRAAAEVLSQEDLGRLTAEGYAPALAGIEPAVVAFTTQVASASVGELLERLIHYGPEPSPTEVLLRMHEREMSTNDRDPNQGHYCHMDGDKIGLGVTSPFLEQIWTG